jgi:hypothetical protein
LSLGVDELVADGDFEDSASPFDELGRDAELLFNLLRQTGGAGVVVSDPAVLDGDARNHEPALLSRQHYTSPACGTIDAFKFPDLLFKRGIKWRERLLFETTGAARARNGTEPTWTRTGFLPSTVSIIEIVQSPPTVEVACHGQDCR